MKPLSEVKEALCCPRCRGEISLSRGEITCLTCGSKYELRGGIPDFRVELCLKSLNRAQKLMYNLYAPLYDAVEGRLMRALGAPEEDLRRLLVDFMEIEPMDKVLEVAVGTGGNIPLIEERTCGLVVGLDVSDKIIWKCLEKALTNGWRVSLVLGCAESLPFKDEFFDKVLIGGGISWYADPIRAIYEALRVVKRGGYVVIFEQVTFLEKALRRDRLVEAVVPPTMLIEVRSLLRGQAYMAKVAKRR